MPRHISPAMQARATFVGAYVKAHHTGGKIPASLFREAHAAFSREHPEHHRAAAAAAPRRNPWGADDYAEEVETATVGTVIGLGVFTLICAAIVTTAKRAQNALNGNGSG